MEERKREGKENERKEERAEIKKKRKEKKQRRYRNKEGIKINKTGRKLKWCTMPFSSPVLNNAQQNASSNHSSANFLSFQLFSMMNNRWCQHGEQAVVSAIPLASWGQLSQFRHLVHPCAPTASLLAGQCEKWNFFNWWKHCSAKTEASVCDQH